MDATNRVIFGLTIFLGLSLLAEETQSPVVPEQLVFDETPEYFICTEAFKQLAAKNTDFANVDVSQLKAGDVLFTSNIHSFFKKVHPRITHPYIVLTHGSSLDLTNDAIMQYLDDPKVIACFAPYSGAAGHQKLFRIPVGVFYEELLGQAYSLFKDLSGTRKTKLLYIPYGSASAEEKLFLSERFNEENIVYELAEDSFEERIRMRSNCKFTLVTPTHGYVDSADFWISIMAESVPVMVKSYNIPLYQSLPLVLLNTFTDLTPQLLKKNYKKLKRINRKKEFTSEKLSLEYWEHKLNQMKNDFLLNTAVREATQNKSWSLTSWIKNILGLSKPKMKVLFVTTTFPKLSETFIMNQVTGLLDRGHDVYVYAEKNEHGKMHKDAVKYNLAERTYYKTLPLDLESYDIIICQFGPLGKNFLPIKKERNLKGKLITYFRGFDISRYQHQHPGAYNQLFAEGNFFLTNCDYFRSRLLELGAPPEKTAVVYSSINCSTFSLSEPKFCPDSINMVTTGRLVEKKGIEVALRALPTVLEKYPNTHYTILGDGQLMEHLTSVAQEFDIEDNVTFAGWCTSSEIADCLRSSDIFLLPCVTAKNFDQDAIPNVLKEAMACGLPLISSYHGGIPEIIKDGENGLLITEHDHEALAEKIIYLIEHPEQGKLFGIRGRAVVEDLFEKEKLAEKLESVFLNLLAQNS